MLDLVNPARPRGRLHGTGGDAGRDKAEVHRRGVTAVLAAEQRPNGNNTAECVPTSISFSLPYPGPNIARGINDYDMVESMGVEGLAQWRTMQSESGGRG